MYETTLNCCISYQWEKHANRYHLSVWMDGYNIDHGMRIVHMDGALPDTPANHGVTGSGWYIEEGDDFIAEQLVITKDDGPLDKLIRQEYNAKLAELHTTQPPIA